MNQPTPHFSARREGLSDEQFHELARDLRAHYAARLSQEAVISLGDDEALLSRYFECQKAYRERERERERPREVVKPAAPWHEMQRIQVLVERVSSTCAGGSNTASSGILKYYYRGSIGFQIVIGQPSSN